MQIPKELTTVTTLSKTVALIMFITLPIIAFLFGMKYQTLLTEQNSPISSITVSPTSIPSCTSDAKICPDGSAVGRIPPNCEFQICPTSQNGGKKFSGTITSINYNCHVDGICGIEVGKGFIIVDSGESLNSKEPKGTVPEGLLDENRKSEFLGKEVEVFAKSSEGKTDSYTLFGSSEFYIKLTDNSLQFVCPKNEYVNCMPGPSNVKKTECTSEFLQWAQANCPNFKGAAL